MTISLNWEIQILKKYDNSTQQTQSGTTIRIWLQKQILFTKTKRKQRKMLEIFQKWMNLTQTVNYRKLFSSKMLHVTFDKTKWRNWRQAMTDKRHKIDTKFLKVWWDKILIYFLQFIYILYLLLILSNSYRNSHLEIYTFHRSRRKSSKYKV